MSYKELTIGFVRSGLLGFGGGPTVIPLIRYDSVERYNWMKDEEFGELLALANALPGPIATKMAAYIGYHVRGFRGAAVAVFAHVIPTVLMMIGLISMLYSFQQSPIVKGMIQGIGPIIGVMLAVMTYEFFAKARAGFGWGKAITFTLLSILLITMGLHPAIVIGLALVSAFVIATRKHKLDKRAGEQ